MNTQTRPFIVSAAIHSNTYDTLYFALAQSTMPHDEFVNGIIALGLATLGNQPKEAQQVYDNMCEHLKPNAPGIRTEEP